MKWKNKLKTVLAETGKTKKTEICLEKELTKADKTRMEVVSSVFVSGQLRDISENLRKNESVPKCSNCNLEMNLIENNTLWFCPLGCDKLSNN
jgi:hypothetical protein